MGKVARLRSIRARALGAKAAGAAGINDRSVHSIARSIRRGSFGMPEGTGDTKTVGQYTQSSGKRVEGLHKTRRTSTLTKTAARRDLSLSQIRRTNNQGGKR